MKVALILDQFSDLITSYNGNKDREFTIIASPDKAEESDIIYVLKEKFLSLAEASKSSLWIVDEKLKGKIPDSVDHILSPEPEVLVAKILTKYFEHQASIHNQRDLSVISETANIDPSAKIGPQCIIEDHVTIEKNVVIGPNTYLANGSHIKENSHLASFNFIGPNVTIGKNCKLHSHNVIGSQAYISEGQVGFTQAQASVTLEDQVEMGSSNTIEAGLSKDTRVQRGTKFDNRVFIGSEADIGAHSFLTANVRIGHNVSTGHHFVVGGSSVVEPKIQICDMVQVAAISCVDQDITKSGAYGGHPIQEMKDYLRTSMVLAKLATLRKEIMAVLK